MTAVRDMDPPTPRRNPYVGPRAFRRGEMLPARHRETRELTDLLISERVVLLHSPSGAGKTSLIQAGVSPLLGEEKFIPTVPLRVSNPPPEERAVRNRYVYSVALALLGEKADPQELEALTLSEVVEKVEPESGAGILVLVLDQFEEILTLNPIDWENQRVFFRDLGSLLTKNDVWALLAMREDYMGGLDRFVRYVPSHLRTTYRLDFLDLKGAKKAIQDLARSQGVTFTDEAADEMLRELRTVKIQRPGHGVEESQAPYIEPFQLQVTCRKLWRSVRKAKGDDFDMIDLDDVKRQVDVGRALRAYYGDTVADVAGNLRTEMVIREWFGGQLITEQHFRSQTLAGPVPGEVESARILQALQEAYLVRSDPRPNATWYELTHDKLVEPILADNEAWRRARLEPWQLAARAWRDNRQSELLLRGKQLRDIQRGARGLELMPVERDFLDESERFELDRGILDRTRSTLGILGVLAIAELIAILVLAALLWSR
jgi:hypothetical protein